MDTAIMSNWNKRAKRHAALGLGALAIAAMAVWAMSDRQASGSSPRVEAAAATLAVAAFKADLQDHYMVRDQYAGRFTSSRDSALGFERGGLLAQVLVDEGMQVRKGDLLAKLDTRALEAERQAILARLTAAEASVDEAKARLALADVTQDRQKQLLDKGHISAQRFDEARYERDAVAAGLAASIAQVAQTQADLVRIRVALQLSEIRAPYDGEVSARFVDEGTIVSPTQSVLHLLESGQGEVRVGVPESVAATLQIGDVAQIDVDGAGYTARLVRLVGAVDVSTRTQTAVYRLEEMGVAKPGELARLKLERRIDAPGYWLPTEALAQSQRGLWAAYVLDKRVDGLYALDRRPVELLHVETDRAYVRGTLEDGDLVVAGGLHRLVPGQTVRLAEVES